MNEFLLDPIPFQLDINHLRKRAHVRDASPYFAELEYIAQQAQPIARPRACFRQAFIEDRDDYHIIVEGVTLTSRVLRMNIGQAHRIFPYLATCGIELEEWAAQFDDPLQRFWAETIKELALMAAIEAFNKTLIGLYDLRRSASMSPGSLEDWPIMQQVNLFNLLGQMPAAVGVSLTGSLMMVPTKSVSGIRFQAEETFESCQLCPREQCPGRKAPYDAGLWARKFEQVGA